MKTTELDRATLREHYAAIDHSDMCIVLDDLDAVLARVSELEDTIDLAAAEDRIASSYGRSTYDVDVSNEIRARRGPDWDGVRTTRAAALTSPEPLTKTPAVVEAVSLAARAARAEATILRFSTWIDNVCGPIKLARSVEKSDLVEAWDRARDPAFFEAHDRARKENP